MWLAFSFRSPRVEEPRPQVVRPLHEEAQAEVGVQVLELGASNFLGRTRVEKNRKFFFEKNGLSRPPG
jgi:hypothetical protein